MAKNLVNSNNIEIKENGNDISLDFTANGQVSENTSDIENIKTEIIDIKNNRSNHFGSNVNIPIRTDFTCPSDGIVQFGCYGTSYAFLQVNNSTISVIYGGNQTTSTVYNSWRVNKDDVVKIDYNGNEAQINVRVFKSIL